MRNTWMIGAMLLLAACSTEQENDLTKVGLKGDVKQVLEKTFGARMEEGQLEKWELRTMDEYHYNEKGLMERYFYHVPSRFKSEYNYYTEDGHPINYIVVIAGDTTVVRCEYRLTDDGQLADERYMIEDRQTSRYSHRYQDDQLVETRSYDHYDSLNLVQFFSYDKEGNQDTVSSYLPGAVLKQFVTKKYKGKWLVESSVYVPKPEGPKLMMKSGYTHSEFDEIGNWTRAERYTTHLGRDTTVHEIIEREISYRE